MVEYTPPLRAALERRDALARSPYRAEDPRDGFFGSAIYRRYPIAEHDVLDLDGYPSVRATVELPGATTTMVAVHTLQPLAGLGVLRRQLAALDRLASRARVPVILAGDLNATIHHGPFRALLEGDLQDAHTDRGRGHITTWPVGRHVPRFARLDHILESRRFTVLDTGELTVPGSDHRGVTATIAEAKG